MSRRKRTTLIVSLTVAALFIIAGVAWAAGMFPDVSEDDVHFDAIEWAAANGIVNGYTNGNFGPYDNITRGQAATMFMNYDEYAGGGSGDLTCGQCHDDTDLISSRKAQWGDSVHGTGTAYGRASSAGCAGCHSGGAFSDMVAAGQNPGEVTAGDDSVSRQDCRACHQIHVTGTSADWALETVASVELYAPELPAGTVYDGGTGNLCANCHQPRRGFPEPDEDGMITGISAHWGPHHGPQAATLLGVAGAGVDAAMRSPHMSVANTCVTCHVAGSSSHNFGFAVASDADCQPCHAEVPDIEDIQAEVLARLDAIGDELVALGWLTTNDEDGHPTDAAIDNGVPVDEAVALYNWIYIRHEDKSLGVHNPGYIDAMLTAAEEGLGL